jgi:putative ABC transport system ATP-binding protein
MTPVLETHGLCKHYETEGGTIFQALNGVDVSINAGEFVAIMGPSGSGKSTLLYLMGGLDTPTGGEVMLDGKPLSKQTPTELALTRRRGVGFVFQFFNLLPTLNTEENIGLPLLLDGQDPTSKDNQQRVDHLLELVGLKDHRKHRPDQLSGGQQQRVALARALVQRPAILLADEPTGNLDSKTSEGILALFRGLVDEQKQTIVMVTHDPRAAAQADRVIMLRDGQVSEKASIGSKRGTQEIRIQLATLTATDPV